MIFVNLAVEVFEKRVHRLLGTASRPGFVLCMPRSSRQRDNIGQSNIIIRFQDYMKVNEHLGEIQSCESRNLSATTRPTERFRLGQRIFSDLATTIARIAVVRG